MKLEIYQILILYENENSVNVMTLELKMLLTEKRTLFLLSISF